MPETTLSHPGDNEVDLKRKFDVFDKLLGYHRRSHSMSVPAICWTWQQIWKHRHADEALKDILNGIIGWGVSPLSKQYDEEVAKRGMG